VGVVAVRAGDADERHVPRIAREARSHGGEDGARVRRDQDGQVRDVDRDVDRLRRDDGTRAARERVRDEAAAVGLPAVEREEVVARHHAP
jgi:hypothetical protein